LNNINLHDAITPGFIENEKSGKGHGGRGYKDFENRIEIHHPHPELKPADPCPDDDCDGKVYPLANPGVYVRVKASEPISVTVHLTEKFRCNLCGQIFEICPLEVANGKKYDESLLAHIIMQKCYFGVAQNRTSSYGPLAPSTLSELFKKADDLLKDVFEVLQVTLANDDLISFDDTKIKIQQLIKGDSNHAWGSVFIGHECIIYIFDRNHAGIGFQEIINKRVSYLKRPIVLSDALPSYTSYKKDCEDAHCLVHGRRRFHNAEEDDKIFCKKIIDLIAEIYAINDEIKALNLSEENAQRIHFKKSNPIFNQIMDLIQEAIEDNRYLPNSDLFKAITYWDNEFNKLTLFTKLIGCLLDTNHVERAVKAVIRIRKQAPIFKTEEGAIRVGRMLSLIETARNIGVDPSRYLIWALQGANLGKKAIDLTPWMFKRHLEMEKKSQLQNSGPKDPSIAQSEFAHQMATN
jgi:transposase